jgi:hypothetical protein
MVNPAASWCFEVNLPVVILTVIISILWIKDTLKMQLRLWTSKSSSLGIGAFQGYSNDPSGHGINRIMIGGWFYDRVGLQPVTKIGLNLKKYITWQLSSLDVTTSESTFNSIQMVRKKDPVLHAE